MNLKQSTRLVLIPFEKVLNDEQRPKKRVDDIDSRINSAIKVVMEMSKENKCYGCSLYLSSNGNSVAPQAQGL